MSSRERPDKPETGDRQADDRPAQQPATDFGSFVSSSARKSFRQLSRERQRPDRSAPSTSPQKRRPERDLREVSAPVRTGPIGRKWRDAVDTPPPAPGRVDPEPGDEDRVPPDEGVAAAGGAGAGGEWFRETFFDDDRPNRKAWIVLAALIAIILLIIYLFSLGDDNNGGGGDITPTATAENVINTGADATAPAGAPDSTPTRDNDRRTPRATATEEGEADDGVQEGGDNQRD